MTVFLAALLLHQGPLDAYVGAQDGAFHWRHEQTAPSDGGARHRLSLTSQTWRGVTWKHSLELREPPEVEFKGIALLIITGGRGATDPDDRIALRLARQTGVPVATLYDVPNQPLFGDRREDDLIAHTFEQFMMTGQEDWPLLLPMAKSAVRAMDALEAFSKEKTGNPLTRFIVAGASKRGWTTYLTAVADPRVMAIAPMVFDMLNMPAQLEHQKESWGRYSPMIGDYTERGLPQLLDTAPGRRLLRIVDPFTYRERLTMPKLILLGANDPYWTTDALNLYWDGLPTPKAVHYAPNAGHGLDDNDRVLNALAAFCRLTASGRLLPRFDWEWQRTRGGERKLEFEGAVLTMRAGTAKRFRLWQAESDSRDFSKAGWHVIQEAEEPRRFTAPLTPAGEFHALFGEAEFSVDGITFALCTQPIILSSTLPRLRPYSP
ncbi:MAG: phenylacetic acid degradation protein [Armatimonadetes bacterium]|nr:phenylacetic acid degradation protein [Armatimonadota bacterium]